MIFAPLVALVMATVATQVTGQQVVFDAEHNSTTIIGTWSTGSQAVRTGPGFVNPAKQLFTYPKNTGLSFSFADSGHYEVARYRFVSNATQHECIVGVVGWSHGTYEIFNNGSIVLTPFQDGFQQIQDPCAAISNFIEPAVTPELLRNWRIFTDQTDGFKLHLFQFDGFPYPPMFQVSPTPIMHPTQMMRNVTETVARRSLEEEELTKRNGASSGGPSTVLGAAGAAGILAMML